MAVTYVASTTGTTTATLPAGTVSGDVVVVFAYATATTTPTLPASWTNIVNIATTPATRVQWRRYDGVWTMPTFTSAATCHAVSLRGSDPTTPIGVSSITSPGGASVTFPAVTLQATDGSSQLLRGINHTRPDSVMTAPTGHTVRQAAGSQPGYMTCTKNATTDGATATVSGVTRNTTWTQAQVEVRQTPAPVVSGAVAMTATSILSAAAALEHVKYPVVDMTATSTLTTGATVIPGAVEFVDPSSLSGITGWYDADDASSFTYSSSALVSQWNDKSGLERHLAQSDVNLQPQRSGSQNGRATLTFGGDDHMDTGPFTVNQPFTLFMALDDLAVDYEGWWGSVGGKIQIYTGNANLLYMYADTPNGQGLGITQVHSGPHQWAFEFNGTTSAAYKDGSLQVAGDVGPAGTTTGWRTAERDLYLAYRLRGELFEVVVYDRVLSTPERQQVEGYLNDKWFVAGPVTQQASVDLTATSTLTTAAIDIAVAAVPMTAVSTLTTTAVDIAVAAVSMTATSTLTVTASTSSMPVDNSYYRDTVLTDGPIAYYRLDEISGTTMVDSSANAKNGTYAGAPAIGVPGGPRDSGAAAALNGSNQYGEAVADPVYNQPTFSVEVWTKYTSTKTQSFVDRHRTTNQGGFQLRSFAGQIDFFMPTPTGSVGAVNSPGAINNGQWRHIVVTVDGAASNLYLDGALVATKVHTLTQLVVTDGLRVGVSRSGASDALSQFFNGSLDEVAYYAGALTPAQVTAHYNAGTQVAPVKAAVALTAVSTLTATVTQTGTQQASVAMTATSTLTTAAVRVPQAAVSLTAVSALTTAAVRAVPVTVPMTAVSILTTAAYAQVVASVPMTTTSTLTAGTSVVGQVSASVALVATSTMTVAGLRAPQAAVALTATSTLTTAAVRIQQPTVALVATSTLTTVGVRAPQAAVPLVAVSTLSVTAYEQVFSVVAMTAVSTLAVAVSTAGLQQAAVAFTASSTLVTTGARFGVTVATVSMAATSSLGTTGVAVRVAAVSLSAMATLTVAALRTPQATVALVAVSVLTTTGLRVSWGAVAFVASSTLDVTGVQIPAVFAAVAMSALSTLQVTAYAGPPSSSEFLIFV